MPDQVRVWERPVGEMAFEHYRLPTLIGQSRMGKVIAAAAAAMALALSSQMFYICSHGRRRSPRHDARRNGRLQRHIPQRQDLPQHPIMDRGPNLNRR